MEAVTDGKLAETEVKWSDEAACCVIMASEGYPKAYRKGYPVTVDEDCKAEIFYAGVKKQDGALLTSGGRVLGVVSKGKTLREAVDNAYGETEKVHFENAFFRRDIGKRALDALK